MNLQLSNGWTLWSILLIVLFLIAIIRGIQNKEYRIGSGFWFWTLVGLAVVIFATPVNG